MKDTAAGRALCDGRVPPLVLCAKENVWRLALNERLQEKAQGFLGLWGKAAYEHTEFLVLLVGVGRFWSFQALGEQVVPFDFIVQGAEGNMQE